MMIFGTTIGPGQTTRTTTINRVADNAIFRFETLGSNGAAAVTAKVYHRTSEATSWTLKGTFSGESLEVSGLDEQICLEFALGSDDITVEEPFPQTVQPSSVRVRVLPPQWFNDAVT